jgi:hypothetical protein
MAHVDEWAQFTREWVPIIQPYIEKYGKRFPGFHMAPWINARYPYDKFSESDFERLMDVMAHCVRTYVTWAIEIDGYLEIIKARHIGEQDIVRAYHICARKCIESISLWAKVAQHKPRIHHIFHHGNSAWPSFQDSFSDAMLDVLNILRPEAQSELHIVPLQAADIIAHQTARDELTKRGMMPTPRKLYADRLINIVPGMRKYIDKAELARLYDEEMMLEAHRKAKRFPARIWPMNKMINPETPAKMKELFKPPSEYWLRGVFLAKGRGQA